jgi:hypothetical protein
MFLYDHFEGPLPPSLPEYKAALSALFPTVFDTKYLAVACGKYQDTALGPLHAQCTASSGAPAISLADRFGAYATGERCHEAGYDGKPLPRPCSALRHRRSLRTSVPLLTLPLPPPLPPTPAAYITGVAFAVMSAEGYVPADAANCCYLMRSMLTLHLSADERLTSEGAVLHLSFVAETTTSDLIRALSAPLLSDAPTGTPSSRPPTIRWVDDTSALADLRGASEADALAAAANAGIVAVPYATWLVAEAERQRHLLSEPDVQAEVEPVSKQARSQGQKRRSGEARAGDAGDAGEVGGSEAGARPGGKKKDVKVARTSGAPPDGPPRTLRSSSRSHAT